MIPNKALIRLTSIYPVRKRNHLFGASENQWGRFFNAFSPLSIFLLNLSSAHMSDGLEQANMQHNWSSQYLPRFSFIMLELRLMPCSN